VRRHRSNLIAVVVVLLIAGGVFLWMRPQSGNPASDASGAAATTSQTSPGSAQNTQEEAVNEDALLSVEEMNTQRQSLTDAVVQFETAYWTRSYADSANTRAERLRALSTDEYFSEILLDFKSVENQPAPPDLLFLQNQWSTTASVSPDGGISGELTSATSACVTTLVTVTTTDTDGGTVSSVPVETRREYVFHEDTWLAAGNIPAGSVC
jgi:hypothetical protein